MKVVIVLLVLVVIFLASISLSLADLKMVLSHSVESNQLVINSQQALTASNQLLMEELAGVKKQMVDFESKVLKR